MESVTVKLRTPIEVDGKKVESLTFREATAGDVAASDSVKGETSKMLAILSGMSDTPLPAIKRISMYDLNQVIGATAALLGNGDTPETTGPA
jgi:hypothetical protein